MADAKKEVVTLSFSDMNTRGILNSLVSFDCVIDTDFGLLVLIAQNFFDTSVFEEDFFKKNDKPNDLKWTVYQRLTKNPLDLCIKDKSVADDYYNQFMEQYYVDILDRSMITDLGYMLPDLATEAGVQFTIVCDNQEQIDLLEKINIFKDYPKVLFNEINEPDKYNQFFIKDFTDIGMQRYSHLLKDKHIYVSRYNFNKIENMDKIDKRFIVYATLDNLRCTITKFDLYSKERKNELDNE